MTLYRWPAAVCAAGALLFIVLATANAAGYRYGVSDQAFYIPAILDDVQPALFPHDSPLIESQARLMVLDEWLGGLVRTTRISLPHLFLAGYVLSLLAIWGALALIGSSLYASRWTTAALMLAFTLRHRIPRTSANTFEPYFHPRMLAFAAGALAVAALLRRRPGLALGLAAGAAVLHPTTGVFFGALIGVAAFVTVPRLRPALAGLALLAAAGGAWALVAGPLRDGLVIMDESWRSALASKDSVFPSSWPAWAWLANLAMVAIWVWAFRIRRAYGAASAEDAGLLAGGLALVAAFLVTLPLVTLGVAFFVQLQMSRVFWIVDVLATIYALGALETWAARRRPTLTRAVAVALLVLSASRGIYILTVEHPERSLFAVELPRSSWTDAMQWVASRPPDVHVLADPGHAWKHGTSVRVSAGRDVLLEADKDAAVAMYSREVAMRVLDRSRALEDFGGMTAERAHALAARYDLDYIVTSGRLSLPIVYRNAQFFIYALHP